MQPFFSIIIPTLNEELFVNKILGDLAKQKVKNFELIVVDGNSQDKTQQMILSYKKEMPITLLKMNPPNLPLQKNLGAKQAKSPYLLFLDADMSASRNKRYGLFACFAPRFFCRGKFGGFIFNNVIGISFL